MRPEYTKWLKRCKKIKAQTNTRCFFLEKKESGICTYSKIDMETWPMLEPGGDAMVAVGAIF